MSAWKLEDCSLAPLTLGRGLTVQCEKAPSVPLGARQQHLLYTMVPHYGGGHKASPHSAWEERRLIVCSSGKGPDLLTLICCPREKASAKNKKMHHISVTPHLFIYLINKLASWLMIFSALKITLQENCRGYWKLNGTLAIQNHCFISELATVQIVGARSFQIF